MRTDENLCSLSVLPLRQVALPSEPLELSLPQYLRPDLVAGYLGAVRPQVGEWKRARAGEGAGSGGRGEGGEGVRAQRERTRAEEAGGCSGEEHGWRGCVCWEDGK